MNVNEDTIHIVSCVDRNYLQHLGVLITSLFENKTSLNNVTYHIIHNDLNEDDMVNLVQIENKYHANIVFHNVGSMLCKYEGVVRYGHVSQAGLYRLSIPQILPQLEKVLYFDSDIIINGDITDLWSIDISRYIVAAVEDAVPFTRHKALMMPINAKYFNSGVLYLNLHAWRSDNVTDKVLQFMIDYPERRVYNDQDGLNAVLYNKWLPLAPKYNQQSVLHYLPCKRLVYSKTECAEALKHPVIIHYTGVIKNSKPWHYIDIHPLKKEYYKYLKLTPWKLYKTKAKNIHEIIKKFCLYLLRLKMRTGIVFGNVFKRKYKA